MSLSPDRLDRFARHIVLPEVGGAGQVALAGKHLVLVGLGGIGSPALQYLAAAGIGKLTLVDDDKVDVSNLQRQTLFNTRDIGHGKAVIAKRWVTGFALSAMALLAIVIPLAVIMLIGLLQPSKGGVIALQWWNGMHGFRKERRPEETDA